MTLLIWLAAAAVSWATARYAPVVRLWWRWSHGRFYTYELPHADDGDE